MLSLLTCSTLFLPPSTVHQHHQHHHIPPSTSTTIFSNPRPPSPISPIHHHNHNHNHNHINIKHLKPTQRCVKPARAKSTLFLFNVYLQMYVNAALMREAHKLFDEMPQRTLITWTILMSGYTHHNNPLESLKLFQIMVQDQNNASLQPDSFVYAIVLRACAALRDKSFGQQVHCCILKTDGVVDLYIQNALLTMYANCGSLRDAARVFAGILEPDLVSWSSMLSGYVQNGLEEDGLRLFVEMIGNGIRPDVSAFSIVIGASANLGCLRFGIQVQSYLIKMGVHSSMFLDNTIINFYAKCGDMHSSMRVFSMMSEKDLVSWNTIITGCVHNFDNSGALDVFRELMNENVNCDHITLCGVLQAITGLGVIDHGREVHGFIVKTDFATNLCVTSSLLDMYIECVDEASLGDAPPKIFNRLEGGVIDEFIIASILKWCSLQFDLETGQSLHSLIIKLNMQSDLYIISSVIDLYSKCGIPEAAQRVFERVTDKGMVHWAKIIAGYNTNGWSKEALILIQQMQFSSVQTNEYIYTSALLACLALGDIKKGREVHCKILRTGYSSDVSVVNTLIKLYCELWHPRQALQLCYLIQEAEISWSSLIKACVRMQDLETLFKLLYRIQHSFGTLKTTSVCSILRVCANPILLNVGKQVQAYVTKRGLVSDPCTSNSLIKMYSGCGMIADADIAFRSMPKRNSESWTEIISATVDHGQPVKAIQLFALMCRKSKLPNSSTFTAILKAFIPMGQVYAAYRVLVSMDRIYKIKPSIEHYSCMVEVLGSAGRFEDAQEFIRGTIPVKPLPMVWRSLLSSSRIQGNIKVVKYAAEKLLELEPSDFTASLLLEQVLLNEGMWGDALKLETKDKLIRVNSSWIEIRNHIYEFTSVEVPSADIFAKLLEIELTMEEKGYVANQNHLLHNVEEEFTEGTGLHHTEMKALAFGLLSLSHGTPIRIVKDIRMCGDCHSALKFLSTFVTPTIFVRDSCNFHHFSNGQCSCNDKW